jgi:hypothetical protein
MKLPKLACMVLLLILPSAYAQQRAEAPYSAWSWSGHLDHMTFDDVKAWDQGIDKNAFALGFAAERYTNTSDNTLSLGMSFIFYNDNDEFAQYVEDYWGDVDYEESSANAMSVFAEYGPRYRFGADNLSFFTVRGGISGLFLSERSIGNCSDCYSEDIDIDGGLYGVLGIGRSGTFIDFSLQFQQYFTGDIDNVLRLKISGTF